MKCPHCDSTELKTVHEPFSKVYTTTCSKGHSWTRKERKPKETPAQRIARLKAELEQAEAELRREETLSQ